MTTLGSTLRGRYRLDARLGAGGMSTVYRAFDTVLERPVAIKLLAEHLAEDQAFIARFRHEALAVARLAHPNIVQVFDSGIEGGRHYIVMEFVEGSSGADLLRDRKRVSVAEAADIAKQACAGLEYAHHNGIVHRDVKPGNLLISEQGVVKLADFGVAKASEQTRITQAGSVLGTAAYLSPEQAKGQEAGPTSDLYSLGAVVYQLLSGQTPRVFSSIAELAIKQQEPIEPLSNLNPDVPRPLERAIAVSLADDPRDRFFSAKEMGEAISLGAAGRDTPATEGLSEAQTRQITIPPARPRQAGAYDTRTQIADAQTAARPSAGRPARPDRSSHRYDSPHPADEKKRKKGRRTLKRFAVLLALATIFAGGAVATLALTERSSTDITAPIEQQLDRQIQALRQLVEDHTR